MEPYAATNNNLDQFLHRFGLRRGTAFGIIIVAALLAFEIFNYSTTDFALGDFLGELKFLGIRWSTILAIAFCGIDFAGIARLFTPESGENEPTEVWYLFGAWLLAATMNAMLTWWGVSIALLEQQSLGNAIVGHETLVRAVPIFVAVMVWLIRVLIIGTFSLAGDRLFSQSNKRVARAEREEYQSDYTSSAYRPQQAPVQARSAHSAPVHRPAPKPASIDSTYNRPDPTYSPVSMAPRSNSGNGSARTQIPPRR